MRRKPHQPVGIQSNFARLRTGCGIEWEGRPPGLHDFRHDVDGGLCALVGCRAWSRRCRARLTRAGRVTQCGGEAGEDGSGGSLMGSVAVWGIPLMVRVMSWMG